MWTNIRPMLAVLAIMQIVPPTTLTEFLGPAFAVLQVAFILNFSLKCSTFYLFAFFYKIIFSWLRYSCWFQHFTIRWLCSHGLYISFQMLNFWHGIKYSQVKTSIELTWKHWIVEEMDHVSKISSFAIIKRTARVDQWETLYGHLRSALTQHYCCFTNATIFIVTSQFKL